MRTTVVVPPSSTVSKVCPHPGRAHESVGKVLPASRRPVHRNPNCRQDADGTLECIGKAWRSVGIASTSRPNAFTRAELLVVVAVFALLALIVLPALANNRPRSHRVMCANNLRQIGLAMQLWGSDHNDLVKKIRR